MSKKQIHSKHIRAQTGTSWTPAIGGQSPGCTSNPARESTLLAASTGARAHDEGRQAPVLNMADIANMFESEELERIVRYDFHQRSERVA